MSKYIKIEKVENKSYGGYVGFQITDQSHRGKEFGIPKGRFGPTAFIATNGIRLESLDCPEWRSPKILFVRGSKRSSDTTILRCEESKYPKILKAVEEYNKMSMMLDTSFDTGLFEI